MKVLVLFTFFLLVNGGEQPDFDEFCLMYNKSYDSDAELSAARSNYKKAVSFIESFNSDPQHSFFLDVNRFSDIHISAAQKLSGYKSSIFSKILETEEFVRERADLPDTLDWRRFGAVTPVQDQGFTCGACWAFTTVGVLEGAIAVKRKTLAAKLSAQQLIDCSFDVKLGNLGCDGGYMAVGLAYAVSNDIALDTRYPYIQTRKTCTYNKTQTKYSFSQPVMVKAGDEQALKVAVATIGPVAVAIDGSHESFFYYSRGVYFEPKCTQRVTHSVVIVGYGTDPIGGDFWLAKNSWSQDWGERGYIKMARNRKSHCGIARHAVYIKLNIS